MDEILKNFAAQLAKLKINWVALLFDSEFHSALAALLAVVKRHSESPEQLPS